MHAATRKSTLLVAFACGTFAYGASAFGQAAQQAIDLDKDIALAKRLAELAELKRKAEPPTPPISPARMASSMGITPAAEEPFAVRAIYGPTTALRALVSHRDALPVELSMRPGGEREIAGWRLSAVTTHAVVLERRASAASAPGPSKQLPSSEAGATSERLVVPFRMQSLMPITAASPVPVTVGNSQTYSPTALPATIVPVLAPRPERITEGSR